MKDQSRVDLRVEVKASDGISTRDSNLSGVDGVKQTFEERKLT